LLPLPLRIAISSHCATLLPLPLWIAISSHCPTLLPHPLVDRHLQSLLNLASSPLVGEDGGEGDHFLSKMLTHLKKSLFFLWHLYFVLPIENWVEGINVLYGALNVISWPRITYLEFEL
jgi:hypothetical protein